MIKKKVNVALINYLVSKSDFQKVRSEISEYEFSGKDRAL